MPKEKETDMAGGNDPDQKVLANPWAWAMGAKAYMELLRLNPEHKTPRAEFDEKFIRNGELLENAVRNSLWSLESGERWTLREPFLRKLIEDHRLNTERLWKQLAEHRDAFKLENKLLQRETGGFDIPIAGEPGFDYLPAVLPTKIEPSDGARKQGLPSIDSPSGIEEDLSRRKLGGPLALLSDKNRAFTLTYDADWIEKRSEQIPAGTALFLFEDGSVRKGVNEWAKLRVSVVARLGGKVIFSRTATTQEKRLRWVENTGRTEGGNVFGGTS